MDLQDLRMMELLTSYVRSHSGLVLRHGKERFSKQGKGAGEPPTQACLLCAVRVSLSEAAISFSALSP